MSPIPDPRASHYNGLAEDADIGTSSDDYARRFTGGVGRWFLETQTRLTLKLLRELPVGASILDVGGGHAQIAPPLVDAGYQVTVVGSDPICAARLEPWTAGGKCRFEVADLRALPYPDRSFDAVVCFRLLPHSVSWNRLIGELCRVARRSVVLDYPSVRSANILSARLFELKRGIELNTREFMLFSSSQINSAFADRGFIVRKEQPQFLLPMVLHRWADLRRSPCRGATAARPPPGRHVLLDEQRAHSAVGARDGRRYPPRRRAHQPWARVRGPE